MTNEEKSENIVAGIILKNIINSVVGRDGEHTTNLMKKAVLEMAEWKDESAKFAFCKTICPKNCRLSFGQSCVMLDSFIKELKKGETN